MRKKPKIENTFETRLLTDAVWQIIEDETSVRREDFNNDSRIVEDMIG